MEAPVSDRIGFDCCGWLALVGGFSNAPRQGSAQSEGGGRCWSAPTVEVIHPQRGGIPRQTIQPGSLLAFESVDLYAMVSGYLKTQVVDIGSRIKKGEVLAEIDAPREAKAVDAAASLLEQAKAQTLQAVARVKSMEGERDAAAAAVEQAKSDIDRLVAAKEYAQKTFDRVQALLKDRAIDALNLDEHQASSPRQWLLNGRPTWQSSPPKRIGRSPSQG